MSDPADLTARLLALYDARAVLQAEIEAAHRALEAFDPAVVPQACARRAEEAAAHVLLARRESYRAARHAKGTPAKPKVDRATQAALTSEEKEERARALSRSRNAKYYASLTAEQKAARVARSTAARARRQAKAATTV